MEKDYFCIKDFKEIESFGKMFDSFDNNNNNKNSYCLLKDDQKCKITIGDMIYVAFRNLPDKSNRLFIRCKVKNIENDDIYVGSIRGISNTFYKRFRIDDLKCDYKKNKLYYFPDEWKNSKDDLDKNGFENPKEYFTLRNLKDYYYVFKCECCGTLKTYINTNHVQGAEFHHLVPRCSENGKDGFINSDDNYIMLCPTCHSKIHHAELNERFELIKKLFDKKNEDTNGKYMEDVKYYIDNKKINSEDEIINHIFEEYYLNQREKDLWPNYKRK